MGRGSYSLNSKCPAEYLFAEAHPPVIKVSDSQPSWFCAATCQCLQMFLVFNLAGPTATWGGGDQGVPSAPRSAQDVPRQSHQPPTSVVQLSTFKEAHNFEPRFLKNLRVHKKNS